MNTFTPAMFIVCLSVPWWLLYFVRLFHVAQHGHVLRMPRLYLWFNLYCTGLLYYLCQYELEQHLQSYFAFTGYPLVSLFKIFISAFGVTYLYILVVRHYTPLRVTPRIDPVMVTFIGLAILINFVLYDRIPYFKLQLVTNVLLSVANLCGAVAIFPMMRQLTSRHFSQMRQAHHAWTVLLLSACSLSAFLLLIDAIYKLLIDSTLIYSPLFVLATVCHTVYMLAVAVLIGPDRYLFWAYYPRELLTYIRLKRLRTCIQVQIPDQPAYDIPAPRLLTLSGLEYANYRLFVNIMDNYRHLPEESSLSRELAVIDYESASYEDTIRKLQKLGGSQ